MQAELIRAHPVLAGLILLKGLLAMIYAIASAKPNRRNKDTHASTGNGLAFCPGQYRPASCPAASQSYAAEMSHARQPSNAAAAEAGQLLIVDPVAGADPAAHRAPQISIGACRALLGQPPSSSLADDCLQTMKSSTASARERTASSTKRETGKMRAHAASRARRRGVTLLRTGSPAHRHSPRCLSTSCRHGQALTDLK